MVKGWGREGTRKRRWEEEGAADLYKKKGIKRHRRMRRREKDDGYG